MLRAEICVAAALPIIAKVGKLAAAIAIALVVDAALGTAMPEWLATSLYTSKRNDGTGALRYLKGHFDAQAGSGNDRAAGLQRMQASYNKKYDRTRLESDWATVLKAMGMAKADPLSCIGSCCRRSGIVMAPWSELKSCLKPKRSRMMRTEYNTALQAGMRRTLGSVNGPQQDNNNSPPPTFVPQSPVAPSPQPRVAVLVDSSW